MKQLSTFELVPGMVIGKDVYDFHRQLIITRGAVLTDNMITKLELHGIWYVYVEETVPKNSSVPTPEVTPDPAKPLSYLERIKESEEFKQFEQEYHLGLDTFKDAMNSVIQKNIKLDVDTLLKETMSVIMNRKGQVGILDMLHSMRDFDDSTYTHCMNVALICSVLAQWLDFDTKDVETATACGLFHDIGKLLVPHDIISKPGKLSDEEYAQIQKHPVSGYQLLMNQDVSDHVRNAALMHHERYDGTGYPHRLRDEEIDKFARIVAIADVYEAMTAARVYRGPLCPFKAIEIFESEGYQKYDIQYLLIFLENVVNSYIQNRCLLSDGREGTIIYINKEKISRPIVQCDGEYVNLAERLDLNIVELI